MKCKNDDGQCGIGGYCVECPALDMTKWEFFKSAVSDYFDPARVFIWKIRGWFK